MGQLEEGEASTPKLWSPRRPFQYSPKSQGTLSEPSQDPMVLKHKQNFNL